MRLIDGDALEKRLKKHRNLFCRNQVEFRLLSIADKTRVDEIDNCIAEVINAPTIEPERKTGEWVGYDGDWLKTMCKCSECGAMIDINEKYRNFFCYHCGADMRGEKHETD